GNGLFSIYDEVAPGGGMRQVLHDPAERPLYTSYSWYTSAAAAGSGQTVFVGPYSEDGKSFISTLRAFDRSGRLAGVMAVDTLTATFVTQNMAQLLSNGEIAWIESRTGARRILGTAPIPKDADRIDQALPLRYTHASLHLSSDASSLHAINRRIVSAAAVVIAAIWIFAGLLSAALVQIWRSREQAQRLEQDRSRLENTIAVGKRVEAELRKAAYTDTLTNLPNRGAFLDRASTALKRESGEAAVFFIDLDRFNIVNETLGHLAGDDLLKRIAVRLRDGLPATAWMARLGGDEFVVLAHVAAESAGAFASRILELLRDPIVVRDRSVYTGASIGVVVVDSDYRLPEELLRDADIAMYEAKRRGRACYAVFDAAMRRQIAAESDLENDLRRAIERREFLPHYQPIVDAQSKAVVSFEALVRWQRPGGGLAEASEFIGYAERRGLVDAIDVSMLEQVCRDAATLFDRFPNATVSVNVSAVHLTAPDLAESIDVVLRAHDVSPQRVKLEVTETAIMANADQARATLELLRRNGIQIVLDDFGAGHSSLAYLHRLPIAGLKIDRSFVTPIARDAQAAAIVRSIVALAQTLGLYTVAEGVETSEQLDVLRQLGVTNAQGFLFSPAVTLAALLGTTADRVRDTVRPTHSG
ncbi:MAG TPA: EAL domain-containing protein, partial [Candidatus Baltobacteraceae bacterium]|nr:EAL domain-containing protein [Candidatus Baltobacteraceae bacterium]